MYMYWYFSMRIININCDNMEDWSDESCALIHVPIAGIRIWIFDVNIYIYIYIFIYTFIYLFIYVYIMLDVSNLGVSIYMYQNMIAG